MTRQRRAWLEPLGCIAIGERLHAGAQFVVHEAWSSDGAALCVKIPAGPGDVSAMPWQSSGSGVATSLWGGSTERLAELGREELLASHLLVLEAAAIQRSRGAWNHEVACLGVWGGFTDEAGWRSDAPPAAFQTALVTHRVPGVSLASLPRDEVRTLFPHLLPALWTALEAAPHGDLSLGNLVLDRQRGRFALVDPGVVLQRHASGSEGGAGGWMSFDCIFTTNAHAYPIFPPMWDAPRFAWNVQLDLFARVARLPSGPTLRPDQAGDLAAMWGLPPAAPATTPRSRLPDQVALGMLYDCLLADGHPVYGHGPAVPLWTGSFGEHGVPAVVHWVERGAPLVLARERARGIPAAAAALAEKLIRGEVSGRDELETLVAAVTT